MCPGVLSRRSIPSEAHVPTQQPPTFTATRFPDPHVHQGGPACAAGPTSEAKAQAERLIDSLRRRSDIMTVQQTGIRRSTATVRAQSVTLNGSDVCSIAFVVPRSFGTAPERNRVRRRLRAAAREIDRHVPLPPSWHLIRPARLALIVPFDQLCRDVAVVLRGPHEVGTV